MFIVRAWLLLDICGCFKYSNKWIIIINIIIIAINMPVLILLTLCTSHKVSDYEQEVWGHSVPLGLSSDVLILVSW